MVSIFAGQSVSLCGQPSQVASCRAHSAGVEKPSSAGVADFLASLSLIAGANIRRFRGMSTTVIFNSLGSKVTYSLLSRTMLSCEIEGLHGQERSQKTFRRGSPAPARSFGYFAGRIGWTRRLAPNLHFGCGTRGEKCLFGEHSTFGCGSGSASFRVIYASGRALFRTTEPPFGFVG